MPNLAVADTGGAPRYPSLLSLAGATRKQDPGAHSSRAWDTSWC